MFALRNNCQAGGPLTQAVSAQLQQWRFRIPTGKNRFNFIRLVAQSMPRSKSGTSIPRFVVSFGELQVATEEMLQLRKSYSHVTTHGIHTRGIRS
eukprot:6475252-Amphidinium_carterae.2